MDSEIDKKKCGEVLIALNGDLSIGCIVCNQVSRTVREFATHINSQHINAEAAPIVSPVPLRDVQEKKCGEVLISLDENLTVVCFVCGNFSKTIHAFKNHIFSQHIKAEDELDRPISSLPPSIDSVEVIVKDEPTASNNHGFEIELDDTLLDTLLSGGIDHLNDDETFGDNKEPKKTDSTPDPPPKAEHTNEHTVESTTKTFTKTCKYCMKTFPSTTAFIEHYKWCPKIYMCPHCPKLFGSSANQKRHIRIHATERPEKTLKCPHCPRLFSNTTNLRVHVKYHLGIRNHACQYCDKRFVTTTEKKFHELHHTGEKPFQCDECGAQYRRANALTLHKQRHANYKHFKCDGCDKAFFSSQRMKIHRRIHTKERPYSCKECGKDFARLSTLKNHLKLHSSEKEFICLVCGKDFAQFSGLYSHRKVHEKL